MSDFKNKLLFIGKYWLPPLGWGFLIFYLSSLSSFGGYSSPFAHFDKLVHAGEYGVLCLLLYRAFINTPVNLFKQQSVMFSILFCILYAVCDEIHQMFVPMRTPDAIDVLADTVGAALSHLGLWSVRSFRLKVK